MIEFSKVFHLLFSYVLSLVVRFKFTRLVAWCTQCAKINVSSLALMLQSYVGQPLNCQAILRIETTDMTIASCLPNYLRSDSPSSQS